MKGQIVENGVKWVSDRFARASHELKHADDPQLHMAGALANLMIYARNRDITPNHWQQVLDKFCIVAQIKQEEGPMGELVWVSTDPEIDA